MSLRALAILAASFASLTAQAAPILSSGVVVSPAFGDPVLTQTSPGLASDGDLNTGYVVTSTVGTNQTQLFGFSVRWDYDLSSLGAVSSFTFSFAGILNNVFGFNSLRIGASPFSNFTTLDTPNGQFASSVLTLTSSGSGALDLDNYITGNRLSVFVSPELGTVVTSVGSSISLDMREISADITAAPLVVPPGNQVPEPGSLVLAFGALALAAVSRRRL